MHPVLAISEIQEEIFQWFHIPFPWIPELVSLSSVNRRDDRGTLFNLACTCKVLTDLALPLLWRSLEDFRYLLRLIPYYTEASDISGVKMAGVEREPGVFRCRELSPSDIKKYRKYASYVRGLGWNITLGDPLKGSEQWKMLLDAIPSSSTTEKYLLPNLSAVHAYLRTTNEIARFPPGLAPVYALRTVDLPIQGDIPSLNRLYETHISNSSGTELGLTRLHLSSIRDYDDRSTIVAGIIRRSPQLTHLIMAPYGYLDEVIADEIHRANIHLVAFHCNRYHPDALLTLLRASQESIQWLRVDGTCHSPLSLSPHEWSRDLASLPVLREFYHPVYHDNTLLHLVLSSRLPSLNTLGINVDQAPHQVNDMPETLEVLQAAFSHNPLTAGQIRSLTLVMNDHLFGGPHSWGNKVLGLFPNLKRLALDVNGPQTSFSQNCLPDHSGVEELRLCSPQLLSDWNNLLSLRSKLRMNLSKLKLIVVPFTVSKVFSHSSHYAQISVDAWHQSNIEDHSIRLHMREWNSGINVCTL